MKTVNVKSLGECPYLISLEQQDFIGRGSYAQVCKAYNKNNPHEKLAAKIFNIHQPKKFESALKQLTIACQLPQHPNLLSYKRIKITSKNKIYIIMELCSSSLRKQMLSKRGQQIFSEQQVWNFIKQFVEGYKVLSKKGIVHRDIKPDNILIGFNGEYKIADFGLAELSVEIGNYWKIKGSLCYLAPQLLQNPKNVSSMNDVYSLGVTIFQMCFKKLPYVTNLENQTSVTKLIEQIKNNSLKMPSNPSYSSGLLNLLSSMLQKQPSKRCTWQYIFFILMEKPIKLQHLPEKLKQIQNLNKSQRKFKIIEISDALLKNLSNLDTDLYRSLTNQSLMIIDHVQAEIIAKRQIVYFCDRLQYRILLINIKLKRNSLDQFRKYLLKFTLIMSEKLDQYFEKYYSKIQKSQFLKILGSQKYIFVRNLVKQDLKALQSQLEQLQSAQNKRQIISSQINNNQNIEAKIYQLCFPIVLQLYKLAYYQQCIEIDQLQKWLESKQKSQSLLSRLRKNQNTLKQFDQQIFQINKVKLKQKISSSYVYYLNQADKIQKENHRI